MIFLDFVFGTGPEHLEMRDSTMVRLEEWIRGFWTGVIVGFCCGLGGGIIGIIIVNLLVN